ncbi:hypothetical protein CR513_27873, partial [Mucuna pruriens]
MQENVRQEKVPMQENVKQEKVLRINPTIDSVVNLEEELIHSALIAEAEPVEFEKVVTEEK